MLLTGNVLIGAMEPETVVSRIRAGDALIVGDRVRTQPMALEAGVACLIVTGGVHPAPEVLELAAEKGAAVLVTAHDTYSAARLVSLAHAVGDLMETDALHLGPETLLSEAAEDLLGSLHREAIVVDDEGRSIGILTRTNIARGIRRRVVLVDHNEMSQSAAGIEEASVVEIVDHHRVGDIQTAGPILFLNLPVGSTATIVATRYAALGVDVPPAIAGILLAAMLTDTVLLKSPTTTADGPRGRRAAVGDRRGRPDGTSEWSCSALDLPAEEFDAEQVVRADLKEYRVGDAARRDRPVRDGRSDAGDGARGRDAHRRWRRCWSSAATTSSCSWSPTSSARAPRSSRSGKTRLVERALGVSLADGSAWMPGVLSRKKQIAARLVEASG